MLRLEHIDKIYGEKTVLSDVSLSLEKGSGIALYGLSGSGKTTLIRLAAGLEKPTLGKVETAGKIAVVFAESRLFPSVNTLQNITAVMNGDKTENEKSAREILNAMGLSEAEKLYPHELSSGMAARVAIARAIAYDGDIYLLDEPFKSLDGEIKRTVMTYIKDFLKDKCTILISHDEAERHFMGFSLCLLRDGKLIFQENA